MGFATIVALVAAGKTIDTVHGRVCLPIKVEQAKPHYGFGGIHRVPALRAWWYELPKSASTTVAQLLGVGQGRIDYGSGPQPGDVGFTIVRHPTCRAISGFGTAYRRAAFRTNSSGSACPFSKFPYLLDNSSSLDERLARALGVLEEHGSSLASSACGYAYHHMLSQTYFLWDSRRQALFDTRDAGRPPPPTVVLRLENLRDDFMRFCFAVGGERNATKFCERVLRGKEDALPRANAAPSRSASDGDLAKLSATTLRRLHRYYQRDFACLGYSYGSGSLQCDH